MGGTRGRDERDDGDDAARRDGGLEHTLEQTGRNKRHRPLTAREKAGGEHRMVRTDATLAAGSLDQFFHANANANAERARLDEARREARARRYAARGGDSTAGGDDASTRRARRRGRSRATRVARRGVASRRDADARNREGQLVPPSRAAVDTRDFDDRTRPAREIF